MDRKSETQLITVSLLATLLTAACGGPLFKVKPATELPPLPAAARSATAPGVLLRVAPLLTDEESQELFEANLPLSGLLPLRLEMTHDAGEPLDLKHVKFKLRDSSGHEWKLLTAKQATSRIMKANGIRL